MINTDRNMLLGVRACLRVSDAMFDLCVGLIRRPCKHQDVSQSEIPLPVRQFQTGPEIMPSDCTLAAF